MIVNITKFVYLLYFVVTLLLEKVFSQCPPGMEQDGTCNIKMFCFDPKETCTQGVCCQPSKQGVIVPGPGGMPISQSPFCPMGAVPDGCKMANDPSLLGTSAGGFGGISSQYMSNAGQMGGYGIPGSMGMQGYGMGGWGGMVSPYDGMGGMGMNGMGMMGGGMMGGMILPCHDTQPQCMMFLRYCPLQSILEACMSTCGMCGAGMGGGMMGGMGGYGMGMNGMAGMGGYGAMNGMGMGGYGGVGAQGYGMNG